MAKKKALKALILFLLTLSFCNTAGATDRGQDFATNLELAVKKGLTKRFDLQASGSARAANNSSELDRLTVGGGFDVVLVKKWLSLGVEYTYLADWNGQDKQYFTHRHRYNVSLDLEHKVTRRISMGLRPKFVSTYKVEEYKSYKKNPKDYFRLRYQIEYKMPKLPLTPYASAEAWWTTNDPDGDHFENMRYVAGLNYKLSKKHAFDIGFQIDNEYNVKKPSDRFMLCAGYKFKF